MPAGAPAKEYNAEHADLLCAEISSCTHSLNRIVKRLQKEHDGFPSIPTIFKWLRDNEEFAKSYARVKDDQMDLLAEEMLDIADDDSLDVAFSEDGKPFVDKEHINRSRLRVDTRKWIASKLKPKKYGDKVETTLQNPDGSPLNLTVNFVSPEK
jgi:hypothetical protein